jgi:hypothetical protein
MKFNIWGTYLVSVFADGIEAETEEEARNKLKAMVEKDTVNIDWVEETNFGIDLPITKEIAQNVPLFDDDTEFGGKSHADEMLDEFMEEAGLNFGTTLEAVNESLVFCGLLPYTVEQIKQYVLTR